MDLTGLAVLRRVGTVGEVVFVGVLLDVSNSGAGAAKGSGGSQANEVALSRIINTVSAHEVGPGSVAICQFSVVGVFPCPVRSTS